MTRKSTLILFVLFIAGFLLVSGRLMAGASTTGNFTTNGCWFVDVPNGSSNLTFTLTYVGGSGDFDMHYYGTANNCGSTTTYVCRPYLAANANEVCGAYAVGGACGSTTRYYVGVNVWTSGATARIDITWTDPLGCSIAAEGGSSPAPTAPSGCTSGTVYLGSGAYRDIALAADTYYDFSWNNNGASNIGGFCATVSGSTGATSTSFTSNQAGWYSGSTASTLRISSNRTNCTWVGTSAILTYGHSTPTLAANSPASITICTGGSTNITGGAVTNGTRYWQGVTSGGTSTATPGSPNSVSAGGTYYYRPNNNGCWGAQQATSVTVATPTGNPAVFGNGVWNVYAYNAGDAGGGSGAWTNNYSGFYTENNLGFVTTSRWTDSPSDANGASGSAYTGCPVNADNHSWSAKRTNIPCGVYQIQVQHDDIGQIIINGTTVYNSGANPCCTPYNAGTYVISTTDQVEYRVSEGGVLSNGTIAFNNAFTTLNAGTITYGGSLSGCINFDPPAFGNGGDASGGATSSVTNGTTTYQWQVNGGNILGANAATYDAPAIASPGTYIYRRIVTDRCGNTAISNTFTITIAGNNSVGVASSSPSVCTGTAIASVTHATTGATGIGAASGLPSGVTAAWASNTITISGTPSASGTFNYSIPLTGGCGSVAATGTITVTASNTVGAASSSPNICIGTAIASVTHATTGATGIGAASGLPSGVTAAWASNTITISGTPSASGTFNYSIPLTGGCGSVTATGTITVRANNTAGVASSSPSVCTGTAIASVTHATTGATGIGAASGLPSGVTAAWASNTITISGTPSASGTFNYSIPLTGGCGSVAATGTITVTASNTVGAASSSPNICIGTAIASVTHATTGATGIGAASGLPSGVTAAWASNTITISGTPSASGTFNYSIPLTGGCGSVNATGTISVNGLPSPTFISVGPTVNVCRGTDVTYTTQPGQSNYVWSIPGTVGVDYVLASGGTSISNTATISWLAAGSGTVVSVNYDNGAGCTAISSTNSLAVTLPAVATSLSLDGQSVTCRVNGLQDVSFVDGNNLLLSLRSGAGIDLGDITATSYVSGAGTVQACGTSAPSEPQFMAAYLGRRWVVQAPSAPASPAVVATLPFTAGDLSSLAATSTLVTTSNPFDDVNVSNNGSDLILVKHTSSFEDGDPTNNCGSGSTVAVSAPVLGTVLGNPYVRYSFTGFSEWYLHGEGNISPLPIVLTSFKASCENGQVKLDWETATEINNEEFIIDRSADLQDWEQIVIVPGAGNSNQSLNYSSVDLRPMDGLSYYRLTQRDYDGASETFAPISITCYSDGNGNSMMVFPNPAEDYFTISVNVVEDIKNGTLEIFDMSGKRIILKNANISKGSNDLKFDRHGMQSGQYTIRLSSSNITIRPIKLILK
jgi:hypothetical protein